MSPLNDQLEKQMELLKPNFKELSLEQNCLNAAFKRYLVESEKWQKQSQEQSEALQPEVVERDKETAETRNDGAGYR